MVSTYPAKKNVAFTAVFPILDADGDPVTGAADLDSEVSKDGANFADCTNESSEIGVASGVYKLTLTATEMNADIVAIIVKTSTSGAKTTVLVFYTSAQTLDELDTIADAIKAKTDLIGASVAPAGEYDAELTAIQADLDNPTQYKADVTNLDVAVSTRAPEAGGNVAAILADTNELQTDWADGGRLDLLIDALALEATLAIVDGIVDTILLDTDELQGDWANGGRLDNILDARAPASEYDVQLDANMSTRAPASEYDVPMGRITADVATEAKQDIIDGIVDNILLDTDELQGDWADGGRLDLIIDALALEATLAVVDGIVDNILLDTDALEKIETNRWKIVGDQLIIYDNDGVTPLYTFDLTDSAGVPAMENVYERVPV